MNSIDHSLAATDRSHQSTVSILSVEYAAIHSVPSQRAAVITILGQGRSVFSGGTSVPGSEPCHNAAGQR